MAGAAAYGADFYVRGHCLLTLGADKLASPSKEINNGIKTIKKINNTAATTYSLTNDYERIYQKNH